MPLGDSITRGPATSSDWDGRSSGGYRRPLAQLLAAAGQHIDFVGSQSHGRSSDAEHEGHGGFRIDQLASGVDDWLTAAAPDVVLLMAGTNGVRWKYDDPADYAAELDELIGRIFRRMRGEVHVSLASIPPILAPDQHFLNNWKVEIFNAHLPAIVDKYRAAGRRISFVDVHAVLDPAIEKIARAFAADVLLATPEPSANVLALLGLWGLARTVKRRSVP
jgi:lysophospholipase L1-like esterase